MGRRVRKGRRADGLILLTGATGYIIRPIGLRAAIRAALDGEDAEFSGKPVSELAGTSVAASGRVPLHIGNRIIDSRTITVPVPPKQAFAPIRRIGGAAGWYYADWLW
jgi:hypothetical protein